MDTELEDRAVIAALIETRRFDDAYKKCLPLAERGSSVAQLYLGWMHQSGNGAVPDLEIAEQWYRRALQSDPERAQFYLATLYWQKGNPLETHAWFERAASTGFPPAIYALSNVYRFGYGVAVDENLGLSLLKRAASRGHLFARRDLARQMIRGRLGLAAIPSGLAELARVLVTSFRMGLREPHSDLLLRF